MMTIPSWPRVGDRFTATFTPGSDIHIYKELFMFVESNWPVNAGAYRIEFIDAIWGHLATDEITVRRRSGEEIRPRKRHKPARLFAPAQRGKSSIPSTD